MVEVPDGEEHKNLAWLTFLYDRLVDARLDRGCALVALGGGVIGDLAGFAAATFLRGVPFVQVPDDAAGAGRFERRRQDGGQPSRPARTSSAPSTSRAWCGWTCARSRTLPRREVRAGMAEVIKHGAILGPQLFTLLEEQPRGGHARSTRGCASRWCARTAPSRRPWSAEDEREGGYRAVLNFGHTMAHAIEVLTDYRGYLHGEAVAIGMVFAARLSAARGICAPAVARRIEALLSAPGCRPSCRANW